MKFDVIIIGSGAGGAAAAYHLAQTGKRVLVVEKGLPLPRDGSTLDVDTVMRRGAFFSTERWVDRRGEILVPEEHFNLGGKTKWYGAALLRYSPHEFDADPGHQCLAWPFDYTEIGPWYDEAEKLLKVRPFAIEPDLTSILARMSRGSGWQAQTLNLGLDASILGNRTEASRFDGFASPTDLKSDAQTIFLAMISKLSNVTVLTGSAVEDLLGDALSPRKIICVRLGDGCRLFSSTVLQAAGTLHSP